MSILNGVTAFLTAPVWAGIASVLTVAGIVFAAVYWWYLRRQELRQRRWDQYQEVVGLVWNIGPEGQRVPFALQIAAVYQLVEFKEFAYMTVHSLESAGTQNPDEWQRHIGPHVIQAVGLIKKTRAYAHQAKLFRSS